MMRILKICCAVLLSLLLGMLMYAHFLRDDLSRRALHAVQQSLSTELRAGHFEMDILSSFPRIRFDFHDVQLEGRGGSPLLAAKRLQLSIALFSIFSDALTFRTLTLKDGEIAVHRLPDGKLSLDILKETNGEGSGQGLSIQKLALHNVAVSYTDAQAKQSYQLHVEDGALTGHYAHHVMHCALRLKTQDTYAQLGPDTYLNGAACNIDGNLELNFAEQLYTFSHTGLQFDKQTYTLNGTVRDAEDHRYLDLEIAQTGGSISAFLHLLPAAYRKEVQFRSVEGAFKAQGYIRGRMNSTENPHVHFDIAIHDGQLVPQTGSEALRDIQTSLSIDNGAQRNLRSTTVHASGIRGRAAGKSIQGSLDIADLHDPVFACAIEGSVPAAFLLPYTALQDKVREASGLLHLRDVRIGPLHMGRMDLTDVSDMHGTCMLDNITLRTTHGTYRLTKGTLTLDRDTLRIQKTEVHLDRESIRIEGWLAGLGYTLQSGDPAYLRYDLDAQSGSVDFTRWFPDLAHSSAHPVPKAQPVSSRTSAPMRLPEGQLKFTTEQFQYNRIHGDQLALHAHTALHDATFDATFQAAEGTWKANGILGLTPAHHLKLTLRGDGADVRECFVQCENFSQDVIRSDHLRGRGDLRLTADLYWDATTGRFAEQRLHVLAGITISDGELRGFDMLDAFSTYVHAEDLRNIKFRRLDNFIEVRNGNVYLPAMFVQSNAANLAINGVHTLDNRILYNLKINAGQVLSNKMKKHDPKLIPLPAREKGTFNLFFTIAGTTDVYEYSMQKRVVESSFQQSAELRERIRDRLRATFGDIIDLIEPPEWETIPEYDMEPAGEDTFLDGKY